MGAMRFPGVRRTAGLAGMNPTRVSKILSGDVKRLYTWEWGRLARAWNCREPAEALMIIVEQGGPDYSRWFTVDRLEGVVCRYSNRSSASVKPNSST